MYRAHAIVIIGVTLRVQVEMKSHSTKPRRGASEASVEEKFRKQAELLARGSALLNTKHRIIHGDAREMSELTERESVHLVVTSPPYWTLKQYEGGSGARQLGHWADYE